MKKKAFIISAIIIVLLAGVFAARPLLKRAATNSAIQTISLAKGDLVDSVLVSGTVKSSNLAKVYSRLNAYPVKEVLVQVGDRVKAGDVLARLDTTSLESDIKQAELNVKNSQANMENDTLVNQSNLQNAKNSVAMASLDLDNAKAKVEAVKALIKNGVSTEDELSQAEAALKKAQISYDNAQVSLKNAQNKNLTASGNNYEIQKLALDKLKKNLSDATVTAPINGTVTMVGAVAGEPVNGLLFVVEDTDHPVVLTSVGEYDVDTIKVGQDVIIKTDSTGDREFAGTVSKIAPTAQKDQTGETASTSDVRFDTEVSLSDSAPEIKIGMNVRLTIKLDERKDVFSVPYDAIVKHDDGSEWIQVLDDKDQKGGIRKGIEEVPVKSGLETDMYVEVSGPDLKDGLNVVTNPQKINAQKTGGLLK